MRLRPVIWLALAAVVGAGLGLGARAAGLAPVHITTGSMAPTVEPGQWVVAGKLGAVRRGDIVEFRYPVGSTGRAIKRVAAVAGDTVSYSAGSISVNGRTKRLAGAPVEIHPRTVTVPPGTVFLLGDNAAASLDSRSFGPVAQRELVRGVPLVLPELPLLLASLAAVALIGAIIPRVAGARSGGSARVRRA